MSKALDGFEPLEGTSRDEITCETCDCCVYLGEGDFACDERDYEHVIEDWVSLREPCEKWTER